MRIYLVGFMGSGKSVLGTALASELKYKCLDLDSLIESKTKKTVSKIFSGDGEEVFRALEKKYLRSTSKLRNYVIATGGGAPCFYDNMQWMNEHGLTVYLQLHTGVLFHRLIEAKAGRPKIENLTDIQLMEFIAETLEKREQFYRQAKLIVNPVKVKPDQLAAKIKKLK